MLSGFKALFLSSLIVPYWEEPEPPSYVVYGSGSYVVYGSGSAIFPKFLLT